MFPRWQGLGRATRARTPLLCGPRSPEPRIRSSAAGGAGPGRLTEARPPRPPVPEAQRARPRGTAAGGRPPTPPLLTLKSLPLRSTPRTNGSTPVASMVAQLSGGQGGRWAAGSRGLGQRRPRPFNPRTPPPGRGGSGSCRPRRAQTSREFGDWRGLQGSGTPAGGIHHLQSPVAASRGGGGRHCRLGCCSGWSWP